VPSIYYVIEDDGAFDYYGFVEQGLAAYAPDDAALGALLTDLERLSVNTEAVRAFSATFRTEWQGQEGELVSAHIKALLNGVEPSELWGYYGQAGADPSVPKRAVGQAAAS